MSDAVKLPGVSVVVDADDYIFYASATSTTPAIRAVGIIAEPGVSYENLVLHIWVTSLGKMLTQPFLVAIGRIHSDEPIVAPTKLQWNIADLWDVIETQPSEINVELRRGDDVLHREVVAIEVASPQDWRYSTITRSRSIAAYVQPNHPALVPVMKKAAELLSERGLPSSFSGYQSMEQIPHMVEALWDAMKSLKIAYANPPASWATKYQKVRTPAQVIEDGLATCLDSSVTFASLLENVGLWPVIAIAPGHAWVGYWAYDTDHEPPINTNAVSQISELINNADINPPKLVFLESTLLCEDVQYHTFADGVRQGLQKVKSKETLGGNESASEIVDIRAARGFGMDMGTKSMPARVVRPDGTIEIIEYRPAEFSYNLFLDKISETSQSRGRAANVMDLQVPPRLKVWLDSLLDLSLRNPLINFRNPASSLQLAMAEGVLGPLEDMLNMGKVFTLTNDDDYVDIVGTRGESLTHSKDHIAKLLKENILITRFTNAESNKRLRKMHSQAKAIFEETNSNELHLALGELVWKPKGKGEVRSPLILVPVTLIPKNRGKSFAISFDESSQVTPNYSLLQLFQRETKVDLNMLAELETDTAGINVEKVLNQVREKIAESGLTGVRVDESAHIGFFNFSAYRLWRDLVENWQTFEKNPLVKHLINSPNIPFEDPAGGVIEHDLDSLLARLPIEADSSQVFAVAEALAGKTFILQGPPGTGKSQTITNLLARSLEAGKRVLFVAEKKEALDVVKNRLEQVGLGDFSLDLHDKAMSPKLVKQQLLTAVTKVADVDQIGFDSQINAYNQSVQPMINYRDRLHEVSDLGESIYSAADQYLAVAGDAELPISGEFVASATKAERERILDTFNTMSNTGAALPTTKTNEWFITGLTEQSNELLTALRSNLDRVGSLWDKIRPDQLVLDYLKTIQTRQEFELSRVLSFTDVAGLEPGQALGAEARTQRAKAVTALNNLGSKLSQANFDLRNINLINPDQEILAVAEANASNFMVKGSKLSKIQKRINTILGSEVIKVPTQLPALLTLCRELIETVSKATPEVSAVAGLNFDPSQNLLNPEVFAQVQNQLQKLEALATFSEVSRPGNLTSTEVANAALANPAKFDALIALIDEVDQLFDILKMTDESFETWVRGEAFGKRLADSLAFWVADHKQHGLMQFGRVVQLNDMFKTLREAKLDKAIEEILAGRVAYGDAAAAFNKGYFKAVLENLLVRIGFNTFDGTSNNNVLIKLREAKHNLQKAMPNILAGELAKRKGFDPNLNRGAAGDLRLAITSKKLTPIRTLLQKHWEVISKVSPCVLASPDSTVRFIDANLPPFDLVIFDEASQIRVANSIGAIGRGKATIIVGDSKQMPPTSVAQVKSDGTLEESDDDGNEVSNDAESILDLCSNAHVPDVYLNWHYRSEDETLIAFSNVNYYESRLNTFPNPNTERVNKGLSFRHIADGQFKRRGDKLPGEVGVNENEAQAIVAEITRRANDSELRKDTLGIVTFNQPQQKRIEELLWECQDKAVQTCLEEGFGGEPILIKNLETVQGSERDVILFSIAFSRTPGGKELPLNFGPMNQDGGTRRLNVAVTRAKKQVIVFCSFLPSELKARNSDKEGIRDLANFLSIARNEQSTQGLNITTALDIDNRVRLRIVEELKKVGLNAKEGVGLSGFKVDIAIYDDASAKNAVLGILLDGRRWNSRATVNDRDLLPVSVLTNKMGWPMVERIWLPAWLRDQAGEIDRIKEAFELAKIEAKKPKIKPEPTPLKKDEPELEVQFETSAEPEEDPFVEFASKLPKLNQTEVKRSGHPTDLDYLDEAKVQQIVRDLLKTLTDHEGPVSPGRLVDFVAASFGRDRVMPKLTRDVLAIDFPEHRKDKEGFYFPIGADPATYMAYQTGTTRHPDAVSLTELANIMHALATFGQGYREERIIKDTSLLLGIKALSKPIEERLTTALDHGLETNRLTMHGEYIKPI
jgi:superfamily I DNA and/or RNA helicase